MPERIDPVIRAERLLELCEGAASDLVRGVDSLGLKAEPHRLGAEARHLFVFVVLSALVERSEKPTLEALKKQYALTLRKNRRNAKDIVNKTLFGNEGKRLKAKLDEAAEVDPFEHYYGTWENLKKNPDAGPFAVFVDLVLDRCFAPELRKSAGPKLHTLSLSLADSLLNEVYS